MNPYLWLGGLILLGAVGGWGTWERGDAEHWKAQYASLQARYNGAAAKAAADATAETNRRWEALQDQQQQAFVDAQQKAILAQSANTAYQAKLSVLAKQYSDLGHRCAVTHQPKDTLPGP